MERSYPSFILGESAGALAGSPVSRPDSFTRIAGDLLSSGTPHSHPLSSPDYRSILRKMSEIGLPTSVAALDCEESDRVAGSYMDAAGRVLQPIDYKRTVNYPRLHEEHSRRLAGTLAAVGLERHPESIKDFVDKRRQEHLDALLDSENNVYEDMKNVRSYSVPDMEWELFKEEALRSYAAAGTGGMVELLRNQRLQSGNGLGAGDRMLTNVEKLYAQVLRNHNEQSLNMQFSTGSIGKKFADAIQKIHDKKAAELWRAFITLLPVDISQETERQSVLSFRSSEKFAKAIVSSARKYLEQSAYDIAMDRLRSPTVHLDGASTDGSSAVVAYTKLQMNYNRTRLELAGPKLHGVPIWALIFYSLRLGSLKAALLFCTQGGESTKSFTRFLTEYSRNQGRLLAASQQELQNIYYGQTPSSDDVYKRAVFAVVARSDTDEEFGSLLNSVGDWLWIHIVRSEPSEIVEETSGPTLTILQHKVKSRFPLGKTDDVEAFIAFLVSGQFELAVGRLFQNLSLRCHAVHMAIALKNEKILVTTEEPSAATILLDTSEGTALDFANMVKLYVADFRRASPDIALDYYYLLSDTPAVRSSQYGHKFKNLFEFCVYKLVKEVDKYQSILGDVKLADGTVQFGLISKFIPDARPLIAAVAEDFVEDGRLKDAVELLEICGSRSSLFRALLEAVSSEILLPTSPSYRNELTDLALGCAERLKTNSDQDDLAARNFFFLLDLLTFFGYTDGSEYKQALTLMEKLKLLPFEAEMVENAVAIFNDDLLPAVQACIPLVILRTMQSLVQCYLAEKERILGSRLGADVGAPLKTASLFVSGARLSDDLMKVQSAFRKQSRSLLEFGSRIPSQHLPNLMELMVKLDGVIV